MIHQLPTDDQCLPLLVFWLPASLVVHHQPVILPLLLVNHSLLQLPHHLVLAAVLPVGVMKKVVTIPKIVTPTSSPGKESYQGFGAAKTPIPTETKSQP